MQSISYGLVFANDIDKPEEAQRFSKLVAPYVDGIKIGITTTIRVGISLIENIKKTTGKLILADFKVADIGYWNQKTRSWEGTNAKIVANVADAGADYIICHSIIGISSIQECIDVAHSKGAKVLTLPMMTHKGSQLFFGHPINFDHIQRVFDNVGISSLENKLKLCKSISDVILILGNYLGVDGFIGPANNLRVLERFREFTDKEIFGPGIGRQATGELTPKDQLRQFYQVCGERSATIIGSSIYQAHDPTEAAKEFRNWRNEVTKMIV